MSKLTAIILTLTFTATMYGCATAASTTNHPGAAPITPNAPTAVSAPKAPPPRRAVPKVKATVGKLPVTTVTVGKPGSHSYGNLVTTRDAAGRLHVVAEVYRVQQTGPFMSSRIQGNTLYITTMAHCGTVTRRTWKKLRLTKVLTKKEEARVTRIVLRTYPKPLVIKI